MSIFAVLSVHTRVPFGARPEPFGLFFERFSRVRLQRETGAKSVRAHFQSTMADANVRYAFKVEWFDTVASLNRPYDLYYFPHDKTLEMFDKKNKRGFLKRCEYPSVQLKDLFIGSIVSVYSRQLKIVDYADDFTARAFGPKRSRCLAIILPDGYEQIGKFLSHMTSDAKGGCGATLARVKMLRFNRSQAESFFAREQGSASFAEKVRRLSSNTVVAAELVNEDCVRRLNEDPILSSSVHDGTLYLSSSDADALVDVQAAFAKSLEATARLNQSSCVLIKPHAVASGLIGPIIDSILDQGFLISAIDTVTLDKIAAEEFLEVYKGVVPEYSGMVDTITAGQCVALEICGEQAVEKVRAFVGPFDPEVARHIRPHSLRARFGADKLRNAVHCTDLPEDGVLEAEYVFQILKNAK